MPMKEFNFARAWRETAKPLFDALPDNIKALLDRVTREGLGQGHNLDCAWPDQSDEDRWFNIATRNDWSGPLREAFESVETLTLSKAAAIIHDYGHWMPGGAPDREANLKTWQFANYADQILRKRFPRAKQGRNGTSRDLIGLEIHEGVFRITYSTKDTWMWREVGLCDDANYAAIVEFIDDLSERLLKIRQRGYREQRWEDEVVKLRDLLLLDDGSPLMNMIRAGEKFMESKVIKCKACGHVRPTDASKPSDHYNSVFASEA